MAKRPFFKPVTPSSIVQSAAVFVKLLGTSDYVKVLILNPPVEDCFGLKKAALVVLFAGKDAPSLTDITLHLVESTDDDNPTDREERPSRENFFPCSRKVDRNVHSRHFILVVAVVSGEIEPRNRNTVKGTRITRRQCRCRAVEIATGSFSGAVPSRYWSAG